MLSGNIDIRYTDYDAINSIMLYFPRIILSIVKTQT